MCTLIANAVNVLPPSSDRLVAGPFARRKVTRPARYELSSMHRAQQAHKNISSNPTSGIQGTGSIVLKHSVSIRHSVVASGGPLQWGSLPRGDRHGGRKCIPSTSSSLLMADSLFTFGTALVVPVYTAMIFAPHRPMTKSIVRSQLLYLILGGLYLYLLSISWTPHHLSLMFASKNWLPELSGITRMFSSPLTVASAWLHLLAVDLYAARHIFLEGLESHVETRHSLVLCLMFGPVGILCHSLTTTICGYLRGRQSVEPIESKPFID